MLASKFPMYVTWGPQRCPLYNDAFIPILGSRHPDALGMPISVLWSDAWPQIEPLGDAAFAAQSSVGIGKGSTIRQEAWGRDMLLIAAAGWGHEDEKFKAKAAGFDQHLTKPFAKDQLQKMLSLGDCLFSESDMLVSIFSLPN